MRHEPRHVGYEGLEAQSKALDDAARALLGLDRPRRVRGLQDGHHAYLSWHREKVFKDSPSCGGKGMR